MTMKQQNICNPPEACMCQTQTQCSHDTAIFATEGTFPQNLK